MEHSVIYYPRKLREQWPDPLAANWLRKYPQLFDADDFRITRKGRQRKLHFNEWYLARYLFLRLGVLSLVEKYQCVRAHPNKAKIVERLMTPRDLDGIDMICGRCRVQAPDLLVYAKDYSEFWFAEAKGPGDSLSEAQLRSHENLRRAFGVAVKVYNLAPC